MPSNVKKNMFIYKNGKFVQTSGSSGSTTYQSFGTNWPTNGTTKAFCDAINSDTSAKTAMAYLGEVTFSDLPASMVNAEIICEIMAESPKVIHLSLTSGTTAPYRWEYTYWNNGSNVSGWKGVGNEGGTRLYIHNIDISEYSSNASICVVSTHQASFVDELSGSSVNISGLALILEKYTLEIVSIFCTGMSGSANKDYLPCSSLAGSLRWFGSSIQSLPGQVPVGTETVTEL